MSDIRLDDPNLMYLRQVIVTVVPPFGAPHVLEGLRTSFTIVKTNESHPNRSEISVYNANPKTRALFKADNTRIILEAGYINTKATIFQGDISKAIDEYDRVDIISKIELGDGLNRFRNSRLDKGYPPGISANQVITDIASALQLPISNIKGLPDFKWANGLTLTGVVRNQLNKLLKKFDLEWSIQDETLQIIPKDAGTDDAIIEINPESGLIGSPSKTKKGVEFETLLMPRLRPGRMVHLKSKAFDGIFKLRTVEHKGDSHSGDFRSKSESTDK